MRRRRNRQNGNSQNRWLILVQILILAGVLVFIIFFRDAISQGAGDAFNSVTGDDVKVEKQSATPDKTNDAGTAPPDEKTADDPPEHPSDEKR